VILFIPTDIVKNITVWKKNNGLELLSDGDMEASGTGSWSVSHSAILTKGTTNPHGGVQTLNVTYNGVATPSASQVVFVVGKTYRITGYARGDGSSAPRVLDGSGALSWSGSSSTGWQYFEIVGTAGSTTIYLRLNTGTGYVEFDDVSVLPKPERDYLGFLRKVLPELPFVPYKHQLKAFIGMLEDHNHLAIVPTGGGKSLIAYLLIRYFWENNK